MCCLEYPFNFALADHVPDLFAFVLCVQQLRFLLDHHVPEVKPVVREDLHVPTVVVKLLVRQVFDPVVHEQDIVILAPKFIEPFFFCSRN